jgi:hypothetical protein
LTLIGDYGNGTALEGISDSISSSLPLSSLALLLLLLLSPLSSLFSSSLLSDEPLLDEGEVLSDEVSDEGEVLSDEVSDEGGDVGDDEGGEVHSTSETIVRSHDANCCAYVI